MEDKKMEPSIIWTRYMDFLCTYGRQMKEQYIKRMREENPFTQKELNDKVKELYINLGKLKF